MLTLPSSFSDVYGSLEICVMLGGFLNGFLASQMISYFRNFRHDPTMLKASIALTWAATSASFGCICWVLYVLTMTQHQVPTISMRTPAGFPAAIVLDTVVHCTTQGIYIYRMFKFSRQIWLLIPSCMLVLFEFGLGLAWAAKMAPLRSGLLIAIWDLKFKWIIDSLFAPGVLIDLIITTSICYQLKQNRISGLKRTKDLIDTLIRWTIQSGMVTCIVAIAVMLTWATNPTSNLWLGISVCLTDCYPTMLMALMNGRMRLKNNTKDHTIALTSIRIVGGGTTNSANDLSELSRQSIPISKLKSSGLVAGTEVSGPKT